jgi:glycosyltransferase involved in cell wall biosynthesis
VVGDAAILVAPEDEIELADAISRGVSDRTLRDELRARGMTRVTNFSWKHAAHETIQIYQTVLSRDRQRQLRGKGDANATP